MPDIGFLNGQFLPLAETKVSVEDRGFQFGDGIYEVVRTYGGRPFRLHAHLDRLDRSAQALGITLPYGRREWTAWIEEGVRQAGHAETKVYIQITRGAAPRDHVIPPGLQPTVVMTFRELRPLDRAVQRDGIAAITVPDLRWGRCDIKSVNLLANVLARQRASEAGVFEAIFLRNGEMTEGAVSNVLVVRRGVVATPPEGERILSGVTRAVVLELARKDGVPVEERPVSETELRSADEVLLTGTTVEVLAVVRLDDRPVGQGRPGEVGRRLHARFQASVG